MSKDPKPKIEIRHGADDVLSLRRRNVSESRRNGDRDGNHSSSRKDLIDRIENPLCLNVLGQPAVATALRNPFEFASIAFEARV